MHARADEGALLCGGCGYDLREIPSDRCPECGRRFDPNFLIADLIPWEQRKYIGRWRAFWRTAWIATARPKQLAAYTERPMDRRAARSFFALVMLLTVISFCVLSVTVYRAIEGLWNQFHMPTPQGLLGMLVLNPQSLLVTLAALCVALPLTALVLTGACNARTLSVQKQNRAVAVRQYSVAPLAWASLSMLSLASVTRTQWWEAFEVDVGRSVLLILLIALVAAAITWRRWKGAFPAASVALWTTFIILSLSIVLPALAGRDVFAGATMFFLYKRLTLMLVAAILLCATLWWLQTLRTIRLVTGQSLSRTILSAARVALISLTVLAVTVLSAHGILFMAVMLATW